MDDVVETIKRRTWIVDDLLLQLSKVKEEAEGLSPNEREQIPVFSEDWSEEGVRDYVKEVEKAVRDPIRYRNKVRLEKIGVETEEIHQKTLEDTLRIEEMCKVTEKIKDVDDKLNKTLVDGNLLSSWVVEGVDTAIERLKGILDAKQGFKCILETGINEKFRSELLKRSLEDISVLDDSKDMIMKYRDLSDSGVFLDCSVEFEKVREELNETWNTVQHIQKDYGTPKEEIEKAISGKTLLEANGILKSMNEEYAEDKKTLSEEWDMYSSTLRSLGEQVLEAPKSLEELKKAIEILRSKCLEYLGESGLRLLSFLKGEDEFPEDMGMKDIRRVLEVLRPVFSKSLMGG